MIQLEDVTSSLTNSHDFFDKSAQLLSQYWWLLDFKWTDLFIKDVLSNIPDEWNCFLDSLTHQQLYYMLNNMLLPPDISSKDVPESFNDFIEKCSNLAFRLKWPMIESPVVAAMKNVNPATHKHQSPMKHRESESLAYFVENLIANNQLLSEYKSSLTILDIGCGLGYVSNKLNQLGFNVIGIEAREQLVKKASIRNKNVKFICKFIDEKPETLTFLSKILSEECQPHGKVLMIGLHSCGDLLSYMMNIYTKIDCVIGLACITCCYHKISPNAFPRSKLFTKVGKEYNLQFNQVTLRVGCQCTPIKWADDLKNLPNHTLAATSRALLEEILITNKLPWNRIRCKLKLASSFDEYFEQIIPGFDISEKEKVIDTWNKLVSIRKNQLNKVKNVKILQTLIQPVTETVILVDHMIKLCELGYPSSVFQVYSQLISPRNTLLLSLKDKVNG